jgi:hypothetical protein
VTDFRRPRHVPPTDLAALQREVLARGAEAALPHKLPDRWLRALLRDLMKSMTTGHPEEASGTMLLVIALAEARKSNAVASSETASLVTEEQLVNHYAVYRMALMEEMLGRQTGIFPRVYSLANIFD